MRRFIPIANAIAAALNAAAFNDSHSSLQLFLAVMCGLFAVIGAIDVVAYPDREGGK